MATIASAGIDMRTRERRFYSRMSIFMLVLMFVGFAPSFFLRDIVPPFPRPNPTLPPSVLLHGLLFTLWMLVFFAQTQLVAAGRRDLHIRLGKASMFLAIAMLPSMYLIGVWQVARANQPPFTTPLDWTALPLAAIPAFAYLVWQGWRRRKEPQWHKRVMLAAALVVVAGPSFGRVPTAPPSIPAFQHPDACDPVFLRAAVHLGQAQPGPGASRDMDGLWSLCPLDNCPRRSDRHGQLGADRAAPAGRRELGG